MAKYPEDGMPVSSPQAPLGRLELELGEVVTARGEYEGIHLSQKHN